MLSATHGPLKSNARNPNTRTPNARNPNTRNPNARNPNTRNPNARNPNTRNPNARTPNARNPNARTPNARNPNKTIKSSNRHNHSPSPNNAKLAGQHRNNVASRTVWSKTNFIKNCELNTTEFESIEVISNIEDTASGSKVYSVKEKHYPFKNYIIKDSSIVGNFEENRLEAIKSEATIYNNIMNTLVSDNITPYVIMGHGMINCEEKGKKIFLINETGSSINTVQVLPLFNFFNEYYNKLNKLIVLHILFQIVYTLECFNKINFQHRDLHIKNILVFIRNKTLFNSLLNNFYHFKYGNNKVDNFVLCDIGIDIRIYDFDQSFKLPSNTKYPQLNREIYPEPLETRLLYSKDYIKYYNQDLLTIISQMFCSLYELFKNNEQNNQNLLECLFILQNYLNYEVLNEKINAYDTDTNMNFEEIFMDFYNKKSSSNTNNSSRSDLAASHSSASHSGASNSGVSHSGASNSDININKKIIEKRFSLLKDGGFKDDSNIIVVLYFYHSKRIAKIEFDTYFKPGMQYLLEIIALLKKEYAKISYIKYDKLTEEDTLDTLDTIDKFDLTKLDEVKQSKRQSKSNLNKFFTPFDPYRNRA